MAMKRGAISTENTYAPKYFNNRLYDAPGHHSIFVRSVRTISHEDNDQCIRACSQYYSILENNIVLEKLDTARKLDSRYS